MGFFGRDKSIPPRPSIDDEREFIEWILKYDNELKIYRKAYDKKHLDIVIQGDTDVILEKILKPCNNGEELFNKLADIGKSHENILGMIEKRGGLPNCPPEIVNAYFGHIARLRILPYFIKYKYEMSLTEDIFNLD